MGKSKYSLCTHVTKSGKRAKTAYKAVFGSSDDMRLTPANQINSRRLRCPNGTPITAIFQRPIVTVKCECIRHGRQIEYAMECTHLFGPDDALGFFTDEHRRDR